MASMEIWPICKLTPNKPLIHTSFTYSKLNMDDFSVPDGPLGYVDSTQEVQWNLSMCKRDHFYY